MGEVSVALANWNGAAHIGRCLEAVFGQSHPVGEVVVVDNGSTDGSREWVGQHYPQITLLQNPRNQGFAAGYNRAIAACTRAHVLVLNVDVFLAPDFVEQALPGFARTPAVAAVTGRIFQEGTGEDINGGFFLRRQLRMLPSPNLEEEEEVFGATGAVALFRRQALEELGVGSQYYDEAYFSYGEDIDLAWRLQLAGWRARYQPRARAHHVGSGSLDGRLRFVDKPPYFQRHILKNRYLTLIKNASPGLFLYLLPWVMLTEALVWPYLLARHPRRVPYLSLALVDVLRLLPSCLAKRRHIQARRRVPGEYIRQFFRGF
jgi:GT2 family glycosyltransferase